MPWTKVYLDKKSSTEFAAQGGLRSLCYRDAIREAQLQLLQTDDRVFILGEGVDDPGGVFGSTVGLCDQFGKDRVMDIAVAENGLTGVAIGAALAGMRPIFVHMRMDFLPICLDQIINHAAKWCYMTGGRVNVPMVIRSIIGRGWGSAAQHSQALHGLFLHVPGLKVVMPATPYDAKGLMIAAMEDGNPVMFIEHRWLYDYQGYVPEEIYQVPLGKGVIRRPGKDVTILAVSLMVYEALRAARELETAGIEVEIIDPCSLKPFDEELLFESLKKTGRLVIADVGCRTGSFAAEVASVVVEKAFATLTAPVVIVAPPDVPTPASPVLEQAFYVGKDEIIQAVLKVMGNRPKATAPRAN
jgi:pyruvate/2-oxoglutarate/acetoin dehydrogenase E1 component